MKHLMLTTAAALALAAPSAPAQEDTATGSVTGSAAEEGATGVADALPESPVREDGGAPSMLPAEGEGDTDMAGGAGASGPADGSGDTTTAEAGDSTDGDGYGPFREMSVAELTGRVVEGSTGDRIGDVDYIVRDGADISAVVGVGGFVSLFEHTVAIPLSEFELAGDDGLALPDMTEGDLRQMPEMPETGLDSLPANRRIGALL